MAHEIMETDHLMLAGKPAWHGMGTVLEQRCNALEALDVAKLNWNVEVAPFKLFLEGGVDAGCGDHRMVVRSDTREPFAPCMKGYSPIQNSDIAELAYEISHASEHAVESAGSLRGGRRVWFLVDCGTIYVAKDDPIKPYMFIGSGHDLSMSLTLGAVTTRVVCANTMALALNEMNADSIRIKHTMSSDERLKNIVSWIETPKRTLETYTSKVKIMAETEMTEEYLRTFYMGIWQKINGKLSLKDLNEDKDSCRSRRCINECAQWLQNFKDDPKQTAVSTSGTVWAALNSVTQFANHQKTVKNESRDATRRTESILFGTAGALNRAAYESALALIS